MKTKSLFLCVLLFILSNGYSQDWFFLNANQSLVSLNPSFAGSNGFIRNQLSYQTYLVSDFAYSNSFDAYIRPLKAGVALTTSGDYDYFGRYRNNFARISYAQYFSLLAGRLKIIPSLEVGYGRQSQEADWYTGSSSYFGMRTGIVVNYRNKLFAGVSGSPIQLLSINTGNSRFIRTGANYYLSYNLKASDKIRMQFSGLVFERYGEIEVLLASVNMISFNHLVTGIGLANFEVLGLNVGYRANYFSLGLGFWLYPNPSYVSRSLPLELHASFNLRNKEQRKTLTSFETW